MLKFVVLALLVAYGSAQIVGGYNDVDVDEESVVVAGHFAAEALGKEVFKTPYHAKLARIHKARQQVVAGMNYELTVFVGLTTCKKAEVQYEDIENCEYQDNASTYRKCIVRVFRSLKGEHKLTYSGCILASKNEI